ncbi:MAG: CCA tRNA nucleotidyltransferase [Candidatus Heimdallarchaeota archaeon]|nr:MAG: CCA tRNA nucleotidyltransferase [Candidatus Heimdallarchaeota archaeon]
MSHKKGNKTEVNDFSSDFAGIIPSELQTIIDSLVFYQKKIYIVGGAVRDFFFGFPVKDYDIATNALPDEVQEILSEVQIKTRPIGRKFGTILAIVGKKAVFDVSTFRKETFSVHGKPPEVKFVDTLEEDLARRDFRFNAIAFNPCLKKFTDVYNGYEDIQQKTIQMIGDPHTRLMEDGNRILRLARFASKFNLAIYPDLETVTLEIGRNAPFWNYSTLQKELFKFLSLPNPNKGLKLLWNADLFSTIFPSFSFSKPKVDKIGVTKVVQKFKDIPSSNIWVRLFGLLLFFSEEVVNTKEIWDLVGKDLCLSAKDKKKIIHLAQSWLNFPQVFELTRLKKWIRATGINISEDFLKLIFLNAELKDNRELLKQKEVFLIESQSIIKRLRYGSKMNGSLLS